MREKKGLRRIIPQILFLLGIAGMFSPVSEARSATVLQAYSQPQVAPDFSLEDMNGNTVDIRQLRGRVVVFHIVGYYARAVA